MRTDQKTGVRWLQSYLLYSYDLLSKYY